MVELQQRLQGVLHQGHAGGRLEVAVLLLFPGVGSVVGGDDVEHVVAYRIQQGVLVGSALHRRVALDLAAQGVVVRLVEEEVVDAHFGGDVLVLEILQIRGGGKE